jgi:hypothetical protein
MNEPALQSPLPLPKRLAVTRTGREHSVLISVDE